MNPRGAAFRDRAHAGAELARHLLPYRGRNPVVLALPRGGVPVASEVARSLNGDVDVFVVRKVGLPGHREYAIGAIASGGVEIVDRTLARSYGVTDAAIDAVVAEERLELARREREYRLGMPAIPLKGRIAILVDDGLATGSTMKAAVRAVRTAEPGRVVVAAPVGAAGSCRELAALADEVVCARVPDDFNAVGQWYDDFAQTTDEEVHRILRAESARRLTTGTQTS
jgi:predicted phosphoribosyltransferase